MHLITESGGKRGKNRVASRSLSVSLFSSRRQLRRNAIAKKDRSPLVNVCVCACVCLDTNSVALFQRGEGRETGCCCAKWRHISGSSSSFRDFLFGHSWPDTEETPAPNIKQTKKKVSLLFLIETQN